jgi:hypothetical protein
MNNGGVNDGTFVEVFRKVAGEYKNRMLILHRDHNNKVVAALSEMEKVI